MNNQNILMQLGKLLHEYAKEHPHEFTEAEKDKIVFYTSKGFWGRWFHRNFMDRKIHGLTEIWYCQQLVEKYNSMMAEYLENKQYFEGLQNLTFFDLTMPAENVVQQYRSYRDMNKKRLENFARHKDYNNITSFTGLLEACYLHTMTLFYTPFNNIIADYNDLKKLINHKILSLSDELEQLGKGIDIKLFRDFFAYKRNCSPEVKTWLKEVSDISPKLTFLRKPKSKEEEDSESEGEEQYIERSEPH